MGIKSSKTAVSNDANCNDDKVLIGSDWKGSNVEQIKEKLTSLLLLEKLKDQKEDDHIKWMTGNNLNRIFKIVGLDKIIFKTCPFIDTQVSIRGKFVGYNNKLMARVYNIQLAEDICTKYNLHLLYIPKYEVIQINGLKILIEEYLDINPTDSYQDELYDTYAESLTPALKQLKIFMEHSGYRDVNGRNNPVLDHNPLHQGDRRIALIDLEHMEGEYNSKVIDFLFRKDQILEMFPSDDEYSSDRKIRRIKEIEERRTLQQFYKDRNIITGREPIQVENMGDLGLNLEETGTYKNLTGYSIEDGPIYEHVTITMYETIVIVIREINEELLRTREENSVIGKRHICLSIHRGEIETLINLGPKYCNIDDTWVGQIIRALESKKYIFKLIHTNGHGFFIQV